MACGRVVVSLTQTSNLFSRMTDEKFSDFSVVATSVFFLQTPGKVYVKVGNMINCKQIVALLLYVFRSK